MKDKIQFLFAPGRAIAANADALPEWVQLAPYGAHPTRDRKRVQVFDTGSATQIVQWFLYWPRKLARLMGINAVPVWVGHPDFDPATWPERRRIGSVLELEARDDGLWGKVAWNAEAEEAIRSEGHKYPSVAWECDEISATDVAPVFLWSVGMWHRPNIKSVQPVINAGCSCADAEHCDCDESKPKPKPNTMLDKITAALQKAGIIKAEDSEESVLEAIGNLISNLAWRRAEEKRQQEVGESLKAALNAAADTPLETLAQSVVTELNTARETLAERDARITSLNAARVEDALTRFIETGRITKADEEATRAELNAGYEEALSKLLAKPVQLNSQPLKLGQAKQDVADSRERMNQLLDWVNKRMLETNCSFDEAWEASKTDAATKALHEAARAADEERAG